MSWNEFVFSNKTSIRITRHLVFWGLYGFYFWVQSIVPESIQDFSNRQPYKNAFVSLICFLPTCILSAYACIYWILPQYLNKQRYIISLLALISLFLIGLSINYFTGLFYFDHVVFRNLSQADWLNSLTQKNFMNVLTLAFNNLVWAMSISGIALGIKFSKNWYRQQQENLELIRKKTRNEIQFQKAQIQPAYLARTLKSIHHHIQNDTTNASAMVLKLSELLSYSLYESKDKLVSLEKEISALQNFIYLEQTRENNPLKNQLKIMGPVENKFIPPMLILSIFLDSLALLSDTGSNSFRVTITINSTNDDLYIELSFDDLNEKSGRRLNWNPVLVKANKELQLLLMPDEYGLQFFQNELEKMTTISLHLNIYQIARTKTNRLEKGGIYEPA